MRERSGSRNTTPPSLWQRLWSTLSRPGCYAFESDYDLIQRIIRIERNVDPALFFMIKMEFERRNPSLTLREICSNLVNALMALFIAMAAYLQFHTFTDLKVNPQGLMLKAFLIALLASYLVRRYHKFLLAQVREPNPHGFSIPKNDPVYSLNAVDSLYLYPRIVDARSKKQVEGLWNYFRAERYSHAAFRDPLIMLFLVTLISTLLLVQWKFGQIKGVEENGMSSLERLWLYASPLALIAVSSAWLKRRKAPAVDHRTVGIAGQEYRRMAKLKSAAPLETTTSK